MGWLWCSPVMQSVFVLCGFADQSLLTTFPQRSYINKGHSLRLHLPPALIPKCSVRVFSRSPGYSRSGESKSPRPGVPSEGLRSTLRPVDQKSLRAKAGGDCCCRAGRAEAITCTVQCPFPSLCCSLLRQKPLSRPSEPSAGGLCQPQPRAACSAGTLCPREPCTGAQRRSATLLSPLGLCRRRALVSPAVHTNGCSEVGCKSRSLSPWQMQANRHRRPGPYQRAGAYGSASIHPPGPSSHQQDTDPGTEQPHRLDEGLDLGMGA